MSSWNTLVYYDFTVYYIHYGIHKFFFQKKTRVKHNKNVPRKKLFDPLDLDWTADQSKQEKRGKIPLFVKSSGF